LFGSHTPYLVAQEQLRGKLANRRFLIVGGTKGLGAGLAQGLAEQGAEVVVAGRSTPEELLKTPGISYIKADLSTVKGSLQLANDLANRKFDTVVFSVGIISRKALTRTPEGIEEDLAISYLSRFVLSKKLIEAKALEGRKRIYIFGYPGQDVTPTSTDDINFQKTKYAQWGAHMNTVAFNEALVYETAKRYPEYHVFGLNPGLITTGIRDNFHGGPSSFSGRAVEALIGLLTWSVRQYVDKSLIHVIATDKLDDKTALCFDQKRIRS